jgi:hypothetical protein
VKVRDIAQRIVTDNSVGRPDTEDDADE